MKKIFLILTATTALAVIAPTMKPAHAQGVGVTINVGPEDRTRIKKYVTDRRPARATIRERSIGYVIPEDVELHAVPEDWGPTYTRYRYVYTGEDVVLVDPTSRKVVYVID